jgi:carbohydrate-selective porin OprB
VGFAVVRTNVNGRAAENGGLAAPRSERPKAEYAAELDYSLDVRSWLIVRPSNI